MGALGLAILLLWNARDRRAERERFDRERRAFKLIYDQESDGCGFTD